MSVIFETLKKLRKPTAEEQSGRKKPKTGRQIYSFRKMLVTPPALLFFALLLFCSGYAALWGTQYLREALLKQKHPGATAAVNTEKKASPAPAAAAPEAESTGIQEPDDIPPPPESVSAEPAQPGQLYLPPLSAKTANPPTTQKRAAAIRRSSPAGKIAAENRLKAVTPEEKNNTASLRQPVAGADARSDVLRPGAAEPLHPIRTGRTNAAFLPKTGTGEPADSPPAAEAIPVAPSGSGFSFQPAAPGTPPDKAMQHAAPDMLPPAKPMPEIKAIPKPSRVVETAETVDSKQGARKPKGRPADEMPGTAKVEKSRANKTAEMVRLARKVEQAVCSPENTEAVDLIDALAALKGKDDPYILKIRGYWHIQRKDYDAAERLLKQVLQRNENDLEAGINMAVVEIKTNRRELAKKRLKRLRTFFPENTHVLELMEKLR